MNSVYVKPDFGLDLLTEKGVHPYDYMNSLSKFNDKDLPSTQGFYSKLSEEKTSQKDYGRALKAFNRFNLKDMGDYRDLYLATDAFVLTDVYENFRDVSELLRFRPSTLLYIA